MALSLEHIILLTTLVSICKKDKTIHTGHNVLRVPGKGAVPHPTPRRLSWVIALNTQLCHQREVWSPPYLAGLVGRTRGQQPGKEKGVCPKWIISSKMWMLLRLYVKYLSMGDDSMSMSWELSVHSRGIRAEFTAESTSLVWRDFGFRDELCEIFSKASCQVPDKAVSLRLSIHLWDSDNTPIYKIHQSHYISMCWGGSSGL